MTDIFHEVEEDLRRERLNKLWARYGSVFLTIAVLSIAATAGIVWWRQHERNQIEASAQAFSDASALIQAGKVDDAFDAYGVIAGSGGEGYPTLALFRQAGLLYARNDVPGALAIYDKILNSNVDERMKAMARLRAAYAVADVEDPAVFENRVAPLAGDDSPWRFQARELQALAKYRKGDIKAAGDAFAALAADPAAPEALRERAGKLAAFLKGGAIIPAPAPAAPTTATPETPPADAPQ